MKLLLKRLYKVFPFKKQLFSIVKIFWTPPHSFYKHLHFTGVFIVSIDKTHFFKINHYGFQLENEIFWRGIPKGWETFSISLWIALCKDASVIIDIGANTGIYALIAKNTQPKFKSICF